MIPRIGLFTNSKGNGIHFGVHNGPYASIAGSHWGRQFVKDHWTNDCDTNQTCNNGFVDPIDFIQTHYAHNPSSEVQTKCQGDVCWEPKETDCWSADRWFKLANPPYAQRAGREICDGLQTTVATISHNPNPSVEVPNNHWWQSWWRALVHYFGEDANAAEIQTFGTINTINVYTGTVTAGNASSTVFGTGNGFQLNPTDPPQPTPPDFITEKVWLTTPDQREAYKYGWPEKIKMHAQFKNIGDGTCAGTIIVHFYLSKGYKVDSHTDWTRVGTDEIQCDNLNPGQTHSEEEGLEVWRDIPEPGIWNITAYIDHPRDDHNNGGDHAEKHESNNGSTEAVFEVTADGQVVNPPPQPNLVPHDLTINQVYQGNQTTTTYFIKNQGAIDAPENFSIVEAFFNNTWTPLINPNRVRADHATQGYDHGEIVTTNPITFPPGTYPIRVRADYDGRVAESNEDDNILQQETFIVLPRPKPALSITQFKDKKGCCTTNTGEYVYPDIWIQNSGPASPEGNTIVRYEISSAATGNQFTVIGYGTIEPRELPPGGTDEDYPDNDRWRIPSSSAWKKQWHTVRACVNSQGGQPDANLVCAAYARYSKK